MTVSKKVCVKKILKVKIKLLTFLFLMVLPISMSACAVESKKDICDEISEPFCSYAPPILSGEEMADRAQKINVLGSDKGFSRKRRIQRFYKGFYAQ